MLPRISRPAALVAGVLPFVLVSPIASGAGPTCIDTPEQLLSIAPGGSYRLCADLDFGGARISPIPTFGGTLDGAGHRISNFAIQAPASDAVGLFSEILPGALVQNLVIVSSSVDGQDNVGSLAGVNRGIVANCHVRSTTVTGRRVVGLLVGENEGRIHRCSTGGVVGLPGESPTSTKDVGGLAGENAPSGTITGSWSLASVHGTFEVGGLVGVNHGWIVRCGASGVVVGKSLRRSDVAVYGSSHIGGLVGYNFLRAVIVWSTASATVKGTSHVGGLVGSNQEGGIAYCSTASTVESRPTSRSSAFAAGGLTGSNFYGYIGRCQASGAVSGASEVGGLAGGNTYGLIEESFSTGDVTGWSDGVTPSSHIGGLSGVNYGSSFGATVIRNCYSAGAVVSGDVNVGGLVGINHAFVESSFAANTIQATGRPGPAEPLTGLNLGSVREAYYNRDIDGLPEAFYAGLPATTSEMRSPASGTFAAWDLASIWVWREGSYPELRWSSD